MTGLILHIIIRFPYVKQLLYRTSSPWSFVPIAGRSSDLKINAFPSLPSFYPLPVTYACKSNTASTRRFRLLFYSDGFVQDSHLLPFSPNPARPV